MENDFNNQESRPLLRQRSLHHEIRLGLVASFVGSIVFIITTFICIYRENPADNLAEIVGALYILYILIGPIIGFIIALFPSIMCGFVVTTLIRSWMQNREPQKMPIVIMGALLGGILGFLLVRALPLDVYDVCEILSSITVGALAGGWYAWKTQKWILAGYRKSPENRFHKLK